MVKTILSIAISFSILIGVCVFESIFVRKTIHSVETALIQLESKTKMQTVTKTDALNVQNEWQNKKKVMHIFVPHNDIGYIDYWLGEAVSYIESKNFDHALSKIQVLISIFEQIPEVYALSLQNIF